MRRSINQIGNFTNPASTLQDAKPTEMRHYSLTKTQQSSLLQELAHLAWAFANLRVQEFRVCVSFPAIDTLVFCRISAFLSWLWEDRGLYLAIAQQVQRTSPGRVVTKCTHGTCSLQEFGRPGLHGARGNCQHRQTPSYLDLCQTISQPTSRSKSTSSFPLHEGLGLRKEPDGNRFGDEASEIGCYVVLVMLQTLRPPSFPLAVSETPSHM